MTSNRRTVLGSGWEIASAPPDAAEDSSSTARLDWQSIGSAGTAAAALRANGAWSLDGPVRRFDAEDWWYRVRFARPAATARARTVLGFDGVATIADAWLNGRKILSSHSMFVEHELTIDDVLAGDNELVLRCRALDSLLAERRARPRWRTPMVEHQQLRWFRTTLLGRTPGWSPAVAPVGPWRPVWIETRERLAIDELDLQTEVHGRTGVVSVGCRISALAGTAIGAAHLHVSRNGRTYSAALSRQRTAELYTGRLEIPNVAQWWPHTHGEPALYDARLTVDSDEVDLGRIGFRTIALRTDGNDFALAVNGVKVFCRGACWTPLDCAALSSNRADYDVAIDQIRSAGMNMLRLGGMMVYESDDFLDACDRHGILLWQDFMFANMDYPEGDEPFDASVRLEAEQLLRRMGGRPCLAVLCGNSEGEQQAAMWGAPRERWEHPLFHRLLPQVANALAPHVPYWPSSAHGGAFPHQGNSGTTSYYGVGAYRRPLTDARRADLRFATECLAFANVPEEETLALVPGGQRVHFAGWKQRSPRDLGAGWDFDDIRDHYFSELFGVNPLDVRYGDHERYLQMSRVVSGEVMAATFREWRRKRSSCNGALVWFLRDLWPGAGWGVVGSDGIAKAPFYYLRRALQPRTVSLSDEGGNGLFLHVTNESAEALAGGVELSLYRDGEFHVATGRQEIAVAPRDTAEIPAAAAFDDFLDLTYAYGFGPPPYDVAVATLRDAHGDILANDFYWPLGLKSLAVRDIGMTANAKALEDGNVELTIATRAFAYAIAVRAKGFEAADQYFHLPPHTERKLLLRRTTADKPPHGTVQALNARSAAKIQIEQ